jgi:hypothetical protein
MKPKITLIGSWLSHIARKSYAQLRDILKPAVDEAELEEDQHLN